MKNNTELLQASWIWVKQDKKIPHQYVCFRKTFILKGTGRDSCIDISVDSDFVLYINGAEAGRGQFSDYPQQKTYTRISAGPYLRRGQNVIAVLAYYRGEDFSEHRAGMPGLIVALKAGEQVVLTDGTWKAVRHPAFRSGMMPKVTGQLGFTAEYDARKDIPWPGRSFSDKKWPSAVVQARGLNGFWKELYMRPVPPLNIGCERISRFCMQGNLVRQEKKGRTIAEIMANDALVTIPFKNVFVKKQSAASSASSYSASNYDRVTLPGKYGIEMRSPENYADGRFVVVDMGAEETGLLHFVVDAPEGAIMDIGHGEHLDDGRLRVSVGGRNFADRYICRKGLQTFTLPFRRLGCRYIEVHFTAYKKPIIIYYIGLRPLSLPLKDSGSFSTHDELARRIYEISKRTLRLCMHEHYEDCPWREQSLYAGDSRNQALFGYYAFGNYDFAAASFDLLGRGIRPDGMLELCAPAKVGVVIPSFTIIWITEIAEHWMYSGHGRLFSRFEKQIADMLERIFSRYNIKTGLYSPPVGEGVWNFYEWSEGNAVLLNDLAPGKYSDAPYNLFLHEALRSYVWMLKQKGSDEKAELIDKKRRSLASAIYENFWNEKNGALASYISKGKFIHYSELVQDLALHEGIVPRSKIPRIEKKIYSKELVRLTYGSMQYKLFALQKLGAKARVFLGEQIREQWGKMTCAGATSFWETAVGADDFDDAGSLCHGWSAVPVYYYGAMVLGIKPLTPGFKTFEVSPYPANLFEASGSVPTPSGPIRIAWKRNAKGIEIESSGPKDLKPFVRAFPEFPVIRMRWNGKIVF